MKNLALSIVGTALLVNDVTGPDGKVVNWMVEGGCPNALLQRGFTKVALPAGTEIVIGRLSGEGRLHRANGRETSRLRMAESSGFDGSGSPDGKK